MDLARQPWFRRWAGRFLKIFDLEEANLSDFVGAMSCKKNCCDWVSLPDEVWNYHGDDKVGGSAMVERMSAGLACRRGKCKRSG